MSASFGALGNIDTANMKFNSTPLSFEQQNAITSMLGKPETKNVINPSYLENLSLESLVDMYEGKNLVLVSTKLWASILMQNAQWITSWLAPTIQSDQLSIETYSMEMNLVPYNLLPHGGVPRLITYSREKTLTSKVMYGLGFKIDMLVLKDPVEGPALMEWLVKQLSFCAMITIQMKIIAHMIINAHKRVITEARGKEFTYVEPDRAFAIETQTYCIASKGREYFYNWISQNAAVVQGIDTIILWPGGKSWLNNSDLHKVEDLQSWVQLQDPITKQLVRHPVPGPTTQATNSGNLNVVEIPNFRMSKDSEDYDPLKTVSTVGQFYEVRVCDKQRGWAPASGDIYIFDFPARRFNQLRLVDGYIHSGFWNFTDPQNRGAVSDELKALRDRENSNPKPPRGHVGDDYLQYKAKSLVSLSPVDFRRTPSDGTTHKRPREQNVMLTWDPVAKKYFIPEDMGGLEDYFFPTKAVMLTADKCVELLGKVLGEPASQVYDGLKKIIAEIEAEEYNEDYWKALIAANIHRIVGKTATANKYEYRGEYTPAKLARTHGVPQIMEFVPNTYGGLDLPGFDVKNPTFARPAGFGNAPGLRTIAAELSKPNTPYLELARRVSRYVEAADIINSKLEEFFMHSKALNPDFRPAWFHLEDSLTMALTTIFPDRPPAFLKVPKPADSTAEGSLAPVTEKVQARIALTKFASQDPVANLEDLDVEPRDVEAYLPSGQTLVVPSFLYKIGFNSTHATKSYSPEINWLRVWGLLAVDARGKLRDMLNQIYNDYEDNSGEVSLKNPNTGLRMQKAADLISAIGYQCSVPTHFANAAVLRAAGDASKVASLVLSTAVDIIYDEAKKPDVGLAEAVEMFKVTNTAKSRTSFGARIIEAITTGPNRGAAFLKETGVFEAKYGNPREGLDVMDFLKALTEDLTKISKAKEIKTIDLSSTSIFDGTSDEMYRKAGVESPVTLKILADLAKDSNYDTNVVTGKTGRGSKIHKDDKPFGDLDWKDAKFFRAPLSVSPQLMRSISAVADVSVVLPGDVGKHYIEPIGTAGVAAAANTSGPFLTISDHFLKKRSDAHDISNHPIARAVTSQEFAVERTDSGSAGRRGSPSTRTYFNADSEEGGDEYFISNRTHKTKQVGVSDTNGGAPRVSTTYIEARHKDGSKAFSRAYDSTGPTNDKWRPDLAYVPSVSKVFRGPWVDRIRDVNECTTDPLTRLAAACYLFMPNNGVAIVNMVEKGLFPPFDVCYWRLSMSNYMHDMIMTAGRGEAIVNYMSQPGVFMAPDNAHRDVLFYHLMQFAPYIKNADQIVLIRNVAPAGYIGGVNTKIVESIRDFEERASTRPSVIATLKPLTELFADKMRFDGSPIHPSLTDDEEIAIFEKYTWGNASFYGMKYRDVITSARSQEIESVKRIWYQRQFVLLAFRGPLLELGHNNQPKVQEGNGPRGLLAENCPEACPVWEGLLPEFPKFDKVQSIHSAVF